MGAVIVIGVSGCNTLQSIAVQPPARTVFGQGQELDTSGLAVTANYKKNSETVTNTDSLQITGYDKSRPGEQTITVTMNAQSGFVSSKASNTFIVTVVPVERLSISRPPATTSFKQGDDFDPAGLSVLAEFADAAVPGETLGPERLTFSGYDRDKAGTQTINAEYYGKQASFEVKVAALSKIAVTSPPYNTEYFTGEDLDLTGLVVMGTWEGIGEKPLNVTIENISGFDTNRAGKQDVFVTYSGKTANFSVTYVSMQSISVSKAPAKLKYENGEELDLAGLAIQGTRMGATSIELVDNSRLKISGYDRFKAGEQTVTVTIGGRSAAFTVTVGPNLFVGTWYGAASNIPGQGGARPVILTMSEDSWSLTFTQLVNQAPPTTEYTGTYTRDSGRRATLLGAVGWAGDTVEILSYGQLKITGGVVFGEPGIILTR